MHRCIHVIKEISHWNTCITLVRLFQWLKKINDSYEKDLKDRSIKIVLWLRKITGGWSIVSDVKWDQTVSFKFSTLNWINKLSKDMVQVGLKGSAETRLFRYVSNTATKTEYLIRKQYRLWKINRQC